MWFQIVSIALIIDLTSAFNPIPMGVGTADVSFKGLFMSLLLAAGLGGGPQAWAFIIWRVLFYYIHILNGFVLLTYDNLVGNKRLEKYKNVWLHTHKERKRMRQERKALKK